MIIKEVKEAVKHSYFVPSFYYTVTLFTDNGYVSEHWDGVGLKHADLSVRCCIKTSLSRGTSLPLL